MTDDERNDLPLPDYDHHTTGSLRSRIQGLDAEGLQALITYERAHAARASMLTVLEGRLDALRRGAEPSLRAAPSGPGPETATGGSGGSKADPATAGPPVNPPSHGDPTNPAQPRG